MRKKSQGFMLAEVIITSTVIVTGMILLFSSYNALLSKYKQRENYHNIDAFYATKEMINHLTKNNLNQFINQELYTKESTFLIKEGQCLDNSTFCQSLVQLYSIENMILTFYDKQNLLNLKTGQDLFGNPLENKVKTETFKDYLDYVINYYNIQSENIQTTTENIKNEYTYLVLTEIKNTTSQKNEENYTYASIAIR